MRGTKLKLAEETNWAEFRYENIPTFCFYCGIIGHQEKECRIILQEAENHNIVEGQYDEWLRVNREWRSKKNTNQKATRKVPQTLENVALLEVVLVGEGGPNESGKRRFIRGLVC